MPREGSAEERADGVQGSGADKGGHDRAPPIPSWLSKARLKRRSPFVRLCYKKPRLVSSGLESNEVQLDFLHLLQEIPEAPA